MSDDAAIEETIRAFLEATAEGRGERIALVMPVSLTGAEPAPVDRVPVELGVRRWVNVWSLSAFLPVLAVVLLGL